MSVVAGPSPLSRLREFCGLEGGATFIGARWLILRAVGFLFIVIFGGIITESRALLGPAGITPIGETLTTLLRQSASPLVAFLNAPGLFWLSDGLGMIVILQWLGMAAAIAVTLNLWPRWSLFGCWLIFLSFTSSSPFFAMTQPDPLILELSLLCLLLTPAGFRPGLAAAAPPRRIAVFAIRFMLFRLMIEAGLAKFVFGGAMWRELTAMDVMYATAPFPTLLGYLLHQLPHWFHVLEIGITFIAECLAPLVMIFGGRRWRWFAFIAWTVLQLGIQLTNNFAWLNLGAIGLAVILIDDAMLVAAAQRLRWSRLAVLLQLQVSQMSRPPLNVWARYSLRAALGLQFAVSGCAYLIAPARIPLASVPTMIATPLSYVKHFYGANGYALFGNLPKVRNEVELQGSNDGGETWRTYEFRYKIEQLDRVAPFVAPWYPRFDAILQNVRVTNSRTELYAATATRLIQRKPAVMALFRQDPFPEQPPTAIRFVDYRYEINNLATWRATGQFWRRTLIGDWQPMVYLNEQGAVVADP